MRRWVLGMLLGSALILAACRQEQTTAINKSERQPFTLMWMHHFEEEGARKWLNDGTELFKKTHPEASFVIEGVDGSSYMSQLRSKVVANDVPDLYMIDSISDAKDLILGGYALNLKGQPFLANIDSKYMGGVTTAEGDVWALPIDMNGVGVIYNKDAFAKAGLRDVPATWDEFIADCRLLQAHGVIPIAAGYKDSWTISWDLNPDLLASTLLPDPDWIAKIENGLASFADDPHFAGVLERFGQRLAYTNRNPFDTSWDEALQLLASGQAAMIVNGTWTVDGVKSIDASSNIGLFAFPSFNDPLLNKFAVKSTGGIVVNPKSPHKDAALQVLSLFATQQVGELFQQDKKAISVVKGLQPDFDPIYADFTKSYLQPARTFDWSQINTGFGVNDSRLSQAYINAISEFIVDKDHNVQKCIDKLDQSFNRIRKLHR